jgi:hypothetical protein
MEIKYPVESKMILIDFLTMVNFNNFDTTRQLSWRFQGWGPTSDSLSCPFAKFISYNDKVITNDNPVY